MADGWHTSASAEAIRRAADAALERNEPMWWVSLTPPAERVFCERGNELVALLRCLLCDRTRWSTRDTDRAGVICVVPDAPLGVMAVPESFMAELMPILRRNGLHGTYRQAKTTREYRF